MNDNKGGNSGFLLGLIIGGAVVFLLGTDKGRKILKSLTEEGFEELSTVIERAGENLEMEEEEESEAPRVRRSKIVEEEVSEPVSKSNEVKSSSPAPKRRFFRRSKS